MTAARIRLRLIGPVLLGIAAHTPVRAEPPAAAPAPVATDGAAAAEKKVIAAQTALLLARAAAVRDYQNRPEYQAALKAVQTAFHAFNDKRSALVPDVEKNDARIAGVKKQASDAESAINDACRPNSTATPEQIEELFKQKEAFTRDWQRNENDAMDRAGLAQPRKQWAEASAALAALQDRQSDEVEKSEPVRFAETAVKAALDEARAGGSAAAVDPDPVDDYLRRYPHDGANRGLRDLDAMPGR
jgi:hypothetical protein